jgi:hypothetical protein
MKSPIKLIDIQLELNKINTFQREDIQTKTSIIDNANQLERPHKIKEKESLLLIK